MKEHKHELKLRYLPDIYDKKDPKKRHIIVEYCDCGYQKARNVTYEPILTPLLGEKNE